MSRLPLLISVPHAGLEVPPEVGDLCALSPDQIRSDGDEGAAEIYGPLREIVAEFETTPIARAIVDVNRAPDDRSPDGVIKTHTCWNIPVYRSAPSDEVVGELLERYYRPYHAALGGKAADVYLGLDCHTMAATGPPIGPDHRAERPAICVGNVDHLTSPKSWIRMLAEALECYLGAAVSVNVPFPGGYITRQRPGGICWIQLELSRAPWLTPRQKSGALAAALSDFCERIFEDAGQKCYGAGVEHRAEVDGPATPLRRKRAASTRTPARPSRK